MKTIILTLTCILGCSAALAQLPNHTQIFEPVPQLVTGVTHEAAPSDAIVLFDGNNMNAWERLEDSASPQWDIEGRVVTVNGTGTLRSKQTFSSFQLHMEWRATDVIEGESQLRGNSGIFLHSLYEIQILDSWENPTYVNGQAGSVFLQHSPQVNAAKRPGEWQSYDIIFHRPLFDKDGKVTRRATFTILHNGVLIQDHTGLSGGTGWRGPNAASEYKAHADKLPISMQDHGNPVRFRNIWVRELKDK